MVHRYEKHAPHGGKMIGIYETEILQGDPSGRFASLCSMIWCKTLPTSRWLTVDLALQGFVVVRQFMLIWTQSYSATMCYSATGIYRLYSQMCFLDALIAAKLRKLFACPKRRSCKGPRDVKGFLNGCEDQIHYKHTVHCPKFSFHLGISNYR